MITLPAQRDFSLDHIPEKELKILGKSILELMNLSGVDIGRATHYNTAVEMENARAKIHRAVFDIDRTVYACLFCLPGINDFSKQKAAGVMLGNPRNDSTVALFNNEMEGEIINYIVESISQANRILNLFVDFTGRIKKGKTGDKQGLYINNARTRRIVLRYIFNARNLELWSVKYRSKLDVILRYMWGLKTYNVLKKILVKKKSSELTSADKRGIQQYITSFVNGNEQRKRDVVQCISFILGRRTYLTLPMLKAFQQAKKDITKGSILPMEVLEGLATTFHPSTTKADILNLTKHTSMTNKQKRLVQKTAKKAGVKVAFDPFAQPMVELYIYAMEMGWDEKIGAALKTKAKKAALALPFKYSRVGILVDDSNSSRGSSTQKLKPLAISLATRDMIRYTAEKATICTTSGRPSIVGKPVKPVGETDLATPLIKLLEDEVDAVYVISDGYENAPAGRFAEVLELVRGIGCPTPIYQMSPIASADDSGIRILDKSIPSMPVSKPEQMALSLFTAMLQTDPKTGIAGIVNSVLPNIEKRIQLKGGEQK